MHTNLSVLSKYYRLNRFPIRTTATDVAAVKSADSKAQQLKSWREIPGPESLPIIGQIHHFLPGGKLYGDPIDMITKLHYEYGPLVRIDSVLGKPALIMMFDPDSMAYVLRNENTLPSRPGLLTLEYYRKIWRKPKNLTQSTGLVTEEGETWKQFRTMVNPVLLQPKTIKLYTTALKEVANDMVSRIKLKCNEDNVIIKKFDGEMNLWALESIGVVALGSRLNCLDPNLSENSPVRQLIQCVHDLFIALDELDFQPSLWRYIATPKFKSAMKTYEKHDILTKYFVTKARNELASTRKNSEDEKGVLEKLLAIDEEVAVIMASDMLIAGVDTASNTMMALLYLLAVNPEKQNKLREELKSDSERKPYLRACIKEGYRIKPVVPGTLRKVTKDYNILGYNIPAGLQVFFAHAEISLSEKHYPRAKEYIPERWITSKDDPLYYGNTHPFVTSPFGFGVRSCIGRRIAELEVEVLLSKIIETFKVEWFGPPPKIKVASINYIVAPFNFKFTEV